MQYDYIVIGAGSAGCAAAYELAKGERGKTVLLLEAGGSNRSPFIKIPAGIRYAWKKYDWGYRSQPDPTRNGANENWKRGKVLGGSSSINGMVYIRGAAEDFDRWSGLCNHLGGWSAREITPIFRDLETSDQKGPARGHEGPLHVTTVHYPHPITEAFVNAATAAGAPFNEDYNGSSQEGVSYLQRTLRAGLRWSSADAFLSPIREQANVRILTGATVESLEIVNGRAVGVLFSRGRSHYRETAGDVVLCAGAINTPKILMLSGVGDPKELGRLGIRTVLDLPEVGHNLREQPLVRMVYRSRVQTYNLTGGLKQKFDMLGKFIRYREGLISVAWESALFARTIAANAPDIHVLFAPIGVVGRVGVSMEFPPYPAVMMFVAKSHPVSVGRVELKSRNPADAPLIKPRLLAAQEDVETLVRGIKVVRKIMNTEPLASLLESEIAPGPEFDKDAPLAQFVRGNAEVPFHPVGTCRMGPDPGAVVGPDLRVRGTDNLWVADASIMPDHLSANINAACIMIGAKLGKQLAGRR